MREDWWSLVTAFNHICSSFYSLRIIQRFTLSHQSNEIVILLIFHQNFNHSYLQSFPGQVSNHHHNYENQFCEFIFWHHPHHLHHHHHHHHHCHHHHHHHDDQFWFSLLLSCSILQHPTPALARMQDLPWSVIIMMMIPRMSVLTMTIIWTKMTVLMMLMMINAFITENVSMHWQPNWFIISKHLEGEGGHHVGYENFCKAQKAANILVKAK